MKQNLDGVHASLKKNHLTLSNQDLLKRIYDQNEWIKETNGTLSEMINKMIQTHEEMNTPPDDDEVESDYIDQKVKIEKTVDRLQEILEKLKEITEEAQKQEDVIKMHENKNTRPDTGVDDLQESNSKLRELEQYFDHLVGFAKKERDELDLIKCHMSNCGIPQTTALREKEVRAYGKKLDKIEKELESAKNRI